MELRSGIYKGLHGVLPQQARPQFEEGVNLLFSRWTALCLAIDNEWGGRNSREKAEQIYNDVLHWFYNHKGAVLQLAAVAETLAVCKVAAHSCASLLEDTGRRSLCHAEHYADDLEVDLQDILLQDFNLEAQDDSCREVRTSGLAPTPAAADWGLHCRGVKAASCPPHSLYLQPYMPAACPQSGSTHSWQVQVISLHGWHLRCAPVALLRAGRHGARQPSPGVSAGQFPTC